MDKSLTEVLVGMFIASWLTSLYLYIMPDKPAFWLFLPFIVTGMCIFAGGIAIGGYLVNKLWIKND